MDGYPESVRHSICFQQSAILSLLCCSCFFGDKNMLLLFLNPGEAGGNFTLWSEENTIRYMNASGGRKLFDLRKMQSQTGPGASAQSDGGTFPQAFLAQSSCRCTATSDAHSDSVCIAYQGFRSGRRHRQANP